jgi:hypothetical protein
MLEQVAQPQFVETWKRIAKFVGRSERWCRYTAALPIDPLPVFHVGGIMRLNRADFDAWVERRRAAGKRR